MPRPFHAVPRRTLLAAAGAAALAGAWPPARAQGPWPDKPVRLLVGFSAGTSPDLLARLLAEPLAARFGQPFIVENRAGASGNIAAGQLAKAADQHTFGVVGAAVLTSAPALYPRLDFKTDELAPISVIGSSPLMLVTSPKIAFDGVRGFLATAREAGSRWSYGSPGVGSNGHLSMELLKEKTGIAAVHVPFGGAPAVLTAIIGGDIQMALLPIGNAMTQVQAGRIQAVALTSSGPSPLATGVPALAEHGVPDLRLDTWNAVMAPARTAPPVLERFGSAVREVLQSEDIRRKLFAQGWMAEGGPAEDLRQRIAADAALYGRIVAERGIRIEG
ncbi:Bug family tripartite tricarboxylate transporter substrate binding protein [Pseudorhodoferax sp.]|uniref:Bug family tripartite tricarboxylate transporter substrate binding protein n=1 Tax=Pseudorhodoferax sp. TaxID=1993553 RepID=UPI0039E5D571